MNVYLCACCLYVCPVALGVAAAAAVAFALVAACAMLACID